MGKVIYESEIEHYERDSVSRFSHKQYVPLLLVFRRSALADRPRFLPVGVLPHKNVVLTQQGSDKETQVLS